MNIWTFDNLTAAILTAEESAQYQQQGQDGAKFRVAIKRPLRKAASEAGSTRCEVVRIGGSGAIEVIW